MKRLLVSFATVIVVAAVPASAQAGLLVETAKNCDEQSLSQPFKQFLDPMQYTLVPGGAFEAGDPAWKMTGSAHTVAGNESWKVHEADDSRSLSLPPGSTATSPAMCVGLGHPTLRLFAKKSGGGLLGGTLSTLRVDVLIEDNLGLIKSLPTGLVLAGSGWSPSLPQLVVANLLPILDAGQTPVAFRLVPQGPATWTVDDVYVDPWAGR
jgi:hypothetical protein